MTSVVERREPAAATEDSSEGHDAFISYSRTDSEFVRRLHGALRQRGKTVYVDWEDIPPWSPDWQADLYAAIEGADTFVFVLGPEALASENVKRELDHAVEQSKRLTPLQLHDVAEETVPEALRRPQWTDFRSPERFESAVEELLDVLNTDPEWVQGHTRLLVDANEWKERGEDRSFLLGRTALRDADEWLTQQAGKEPPPSDLQLRYMAASRKAAARRRRITLGSVLVALAVAIGLAALAWLQREEAVEQAQIASSQGLAGQAVGQLDTRPDLAALLSLEAYRVRPTFEARRSVLLAMQRSARTVWTVQGTRGSVGLSSDGDTLATVGLDDGAVRLWDVAGRAALGEALGLQSEGGVPGIGTIAFSADGTKLATVDNDGTVGLWDAIGGKQLGDLAAGHLGGVRSLSLSANGDTLATIGYDLTVKLWDVASQQALGQPLRRRPGLVSAAFSPNGETLATAGADGTVRLWQVATHRALGAPLGRHEEVGLASVAFNANGEMLASTGGDGTARLWDVASRQALGAPLEPLEPVATAAFSQDGERLAAADLTGAARLWEVASGRVLGPPMAGQEELLWGLALSADGETLATTELDGRVTVRDIAGRRSLWGPLGQLDAPATSVAFSPSGETLASAELDGTVRLWEVASRRALGEPLGRHELEFGEANVAFDSSGRTLASAADDGSVMTWDVTSRPAPASPAPSDVLVSGGSASAVSANGETIAIVDRDGFLTLWDARRRRQLGEAVAGQQSLENLTLSADGETLAGVSGGASVRLWDVASQRLLGEVTGPDQVSSLALSANGELLATGGARGDDAVRLWEVASQRPLGEALVGHEGEVTAVAFSPSGRTLASAGEDATVRLWDLALRRALGEPLLGHEGTVSEVGFSPNGGKLASADDSGTIMLWDGILWSEDFDAWRNRLCNVAGRNLTRSEWAEFRPGESYRKTCPRWPLESE